MPETATCPLCEEYEGEPKSVEAHISAKSDDVHADEVGRDHREDIAGAGGLEDGEAVASPAPSDAVDVDDAEQGGGPAPGDDSGEETASADGDDSSTSFEDLSRADALKMTAVYLVLLVVMVAVAAVGGSSNRVMSSGHPYA